jgi:hypothetical protein
MPPSRPMVLMFLLALVVNPGVNLGVLLGF